MTHTETRMPRYWWMPFIIGVFFTPLAIYIAALSWGFGHGDGFADRMLFPLKWPLWSLIGETPAEYMVGFTLYPVYGVILSVAYRAGRLWWASVALLAFHSVCFVLV